MACQFQEQHDLFQHSEDFKPLAIPLQISIICLGKAQMGTRPQTKHISKCWELWLQTGLYHGTVSVSVSFWSMLVVHQCTGSSKGTMNGEEFPHLNIEIRWQRKEHKKEEEYMLWSSWSRYVLGYRNAFQSPPCFLHFKTSCSGETPGAIRPGPFHQRCSSWTMFKVYYWMTVTWAYSMLWLIYPMIFIFFKNAQNTNIYIYIFS